MGIEGKKEARRLPEKSFPVSRSNTRILSMLRIRYALTKGNHLIYFLISKKISPILVYKKILPPMTLQ